MPKFNSPAKGKSDAMGHIARADSRRQTNHGRICRAVAVVSKGPRGYPQTQSARTARTRTRTRTRRRNSERAQTCCCPRLVVDQSTGTWHTLALCKWPVARWPIAGCWVPVLAGTRVQHHCRVAATHPTVGASNSSSAVVAHTRMRQMEADGTKDNKERTGPKEERKKDQREERGKRRENEQGRNATWDRKLEKNTRRWQQKRETREDRKRINRQSKTTSKEVKRTERRYNRITPVVAES
jgi:hypothetical protein